MNINIVKLLFKKKQPLYTRCLSHRTWRARAVEDALYKASVPECVPEIQKEDDIKSTDDWYVRYL